MDYVFRRLALDHLTSRPAPSSASTRPRSGRGSSTPARTRPIEGDSDGSGDRRTRDDLPVGGTTVDRRDDSARAEAPDVGSGAGEAGAESEAHSSTELLEQMQGRAADAPMCFTCGTKMRPAGSCFVCEGCGRPAAAADAEPGQPGRRVESLVRPGCPGGTGWQVPSRCGGYTSVCSPCWRWSPNRWILGSEPSVGPTAGMPGLAGRSDPESPPSERTDDAN